MPSYLFFCEGVIGAWVVALGELTAAASIGWTGVIMLQGRDKNGRKTPGAKYTWPLAVGACLLLFWGTLLALAVMVSKASSFSASLQHPPITAYPVGTVRFWCET